MSQTDEKEKEQVEEITPMAAVQRKDIYFVDSRMIHAKENFNIRIDYGDMDSLVESIRANGVQVPMRGYKERGEDSYTIIDGHRRLRACKILEKEGEMIKVPFLIEKHVTDEQRLFSMLIFNDGKRLNALEESDAIHRLINYGYSEKAICEKLGYSPTHVSNLKLLGNAPAKIKMLISEDVVSVSLALKIMRQTDEMENVVAVFENALKYLSLKRTDAEEKQFYENQKKAEKAKTNGDNIIDFDDSNTDADCKEDGNAMMDNDNSVKGLSVKAQKLTKEILDESRAVYNSIGAFKKLVKDFPAGAIREDMKQVYEFAKNMIDGKFNYESIEDMFISRKAENETNNLVETKSNNSLESNTDFDNQSFSSEEEDSDSNGAPNPNK